MIYQVNSFYKLKNTQPYRDFKTINFNKTLYLQKDYPLKIESTTEIYKSDQARIETALKNYPPLLMKKIVNASYKGVLAPDILSGIKSQNISIPKEFEIKAKYLFKDRTGGTFPFYKLIILTNKMKNECEIQKTVNHELSHAVVDLDNLENLQSLKKAINNDIKEIKDYKIDQYQQKTSELIKSLFFEDSYNFDEIVADTLAWGCPGGGCYGSIEAGVKDQFLMRKLFPNTIRQIYKQYGDTGLVYKIY